MKKETIYLIEKTDKYNTNVSLMRFLAAVLVIIAHAFPLTSGKESMDILGKVTNGRINFGRISVGFFFLIGGFYITKSMLRLKDAKKYFKVRIIRIFPSLIFTVILSIIFGSFITTYSLKEYWSLSESWSYLWNCLLILHHDLPGVFQNNSYTTTVNGSLWSLPVEFLCYIGCYILYKMKVLSNYFFISLLFVIAVLILGYPYLLASTTLKAAIQVGLLFYIGMGFYIYRAKIVLIKKAMFFCVILFIILVFLDQSSLAMIIAFPYIVMYVAFATPQCPQYLAKLGKLSYGVYLSAFPIQQSIVMFSKNPYINIVLSIPISVMIGG